MNAGLRRGVGWDVSWVAGAPSGWGVRRMRHALELSTRRNDDGTRDDLLSLSVSKGVIPKVYEDDSQFRSGAELRKYFLVQPGQFVVNPMWLMHGSLGTSAIDGVISPDYRVYDPAPGVDPRYVHHLLKTREYQDLYGLLARGTTTYDRRISKDAFNDLPLLLPPLPTQRAIADFLDRKTAAIDALIAKKQRLLDLLAEKRAALINQAVTRGLDPTVPMKDSGIPWIGEIPAHWDVLQLRRVLRRIEQGWSPQCDARPIAGDEWGVLKAGCTAGGVFRPEEHKALPSNLEPRLRLQVRQGDLIVSRASGSPEIVGSAAVVGPLRLRLLLPDKLFRLHLDAGLAASSFVALALGSRAARSQIETAISGAEGLANNLPQARLKEVVVVIPPLDEQRAIVSIVAGQLATSNRAAAALTGSIERLQEYRQALITAAVTGQLDVPEEGVA